VLRTALIFKKNFLWYCKWTTSNTRVAPVSKDRDSSNRTSKRQCQNSNRTIFNYLNFIRSPNKRSLMEFWSSCFVELSAEPAEGPPIRSSRGSHVCSGASCYVWKNF